MEAFKTIIWIINIFSALAVIVLVLMQQGKGADAGAAFGSGSAQGVFGAAGNANFLSRSTAMAATSPIPVSSVEAAAWSAVPSSAAALDGGVGRPRESRSHAGQARVRRAVEPPMGA